MEWRCEDNSQQIERFADPTRLRLLSLISPAGEACAACDLVEPLGVSQPTVSHHLKVLRDAGLVESEKRGQWVYYHLAPATSAPWRRPQLAGSIPGHGRTAQELLRNQCSLSDC